MTHSNRPVITFFHTDNCERQTVAPIAEEAERRGFQIKFTSNMGERAQIGVYCQHACRPNADFSIIMLHDLAQRHDIWPEFWMYEPWNAFDMGFVPGEAWAERWRSQAERVVALPRYGVFDVGWPKADLVWRDKDEFIRRSSSLRESLGLQHKQTVLYAPSWENHGKQDDFVRSLMDLPINLLLKQAPWAPSYTMVWDNIRQMNALHQGIAPNVHIVDPEISIMYCIGVSDLLVSDESSVLIEAALHSVPSVAVSDWLIPDRNPPRPASVPFDHVRKTTRAELRNTVKEILADPVQACEEAVRLRDFHFSHFGESSRLVVDLLEAALAGKALPIKALTVNTKAPESPVKTSSTAKAVKGNGVGPYQFNKAHGIYERPRSAGFAYNDGDAVENFMFNTINNAVDVSIGSDELTSHISDWATLYHLSSARSNLFRPIENNLKGKRVLEIGSGCGAISRFLGELGCDLTCVEGSFRRAAITAARCKGLKNVRVFNDNFQTFDSNELFDVVTLIGVLEYSRVFIEGDDPISSALQLAHRFLKPDGVLIVAIENKLGLKYFAGAPEDHIGQGFFGVQGLYGKKTAVTFGKEEIRGIIEGNGFNNIEFYYPFPDYKLPSVILSEAAEGADPAILNNLLSSSFADNQARSYQRTFSEGSVYRSLIDNKLVGHLANSFLLIAQREDATWQGNVDNLAFCYSQGRKKSLSKEVKIFIGEGQPRVSRRLLHEGKTPAWMAFPQDEILIGGEILFNELLPILNREGWSAEYLAIWLNPLYRSLRSLARLEDSRYVLPGEYLDASPFNCIISDNNAKFFDLEWKLSPQIDLDFVFFRGLFYSLKRVGTVAVPQQGTPVSLLALIYQVAAKLGFNIDIGRCVDLEVELQAKVSLFSISKSAFDTALEIRLSPDRLRQGFLDGQKTISELRAQAAENSSGAQKGTVKNQLAVVVHAYYPEVLEEIVCALRPLFGVANFYFTTTPEKSGEVGRILEAVVPNYNLYVFENRGRDVGPLFELMQSVALEDFKYVLKLHTKKSPHLKSGEGDKWRSTTLQQLLPEGSIQQVINFFESQSGVGLAGASASLFKASDLLGVHYENYEGLKHWAGIMDFDFDQLDYNFIGGTMFWARGAVFRELKNLALRQSDFDDESGQLDGTLAHVLERVIPLAAMKAGLKTVGLPAFKEAPVPLHLTRTEQTVRVWNDARKPSSMDRLKIKEFLLSNNDGPKIVAVVCDDGKNPAFLVETLDSLVRSKAVYGNFSAIVVGDANSDLNESYSGIKFLACDKDELLSFLNEMLDDLEYDWSLLLQAGEQLLPDGLLSAAVNLLSANECRAVYFDELIEMNDATLSGMLRPSFNLDMLISFPLLMARHWFIPKKVFNSLNGYDSKISESFEFDFIIRLIEEGGISGIGHISEPLLIGKPPVLNNNEEDCSLILKHIQNRGYSQAKLLPHMPARYRISYGHEHQPLVSIIVPTKDQLPILLRCVESLLEKTRYPNYELLIVDNNSETPEALEWLAGVEKMGEEKVRVLRYPHPFNYSAINNMAAREARGEYLVLLNNDTAIISETWLDDLLNHAQRPEVGIVGAKLLYPDGRIQHAGVILGLRGPAEHPFIGEPMDAPGYMQRLQVDQNYSAVTAACLMIRKSIYDEVGGLDEEFFKVSYNDIDLCLKVGQQGYLIVWTPHAVVMHEGSVSQKQVDPATQEAKRKRFLTEQDAMYEKWLPQLANDPAYNGNLALTGSGFALETNVDLTWRPLSWRPLPVVLAHNADPWGCGNYRVIKPHKAMKTAGLIDGAVSTRLLEPAELARLSPDVVVYQRQTKPESIENMARSKRFSSAFKVYELDDYLPNTPMKNAHRTSLSKGLVKLLRKGLGHVDRFVVSTPALANALSDYHPDIRVIENRLPLDWWGQLDIVKNQSAKPRVGWAGGIGHQGDLELIADVVRELAKEVDWVFFGMCPEDLKPYMTEFYPGVDIELYPQKLASLNLDLALAPLEDNLFNACKSNLRLLEYGVCGFPVIASDIECYRGSLPVTLVKNRYRDWVDSIRGQLAEREALSASADALQNAVRKDWMLDGVNLEQWRSAWLPD